VSPAPRVHVHLVSWTEEPWDVDASLFSLVTQEEVMATVSVSVPPALEAHASEACASLARLGGQVELQPGTPSRWPPDAEAVAVWVAGTVATPDHLARALLACGNGTAAALAVAPARRVLRRSFAGRPPYVLRKARRFSPSVPTLAELERDPAFLGRCLVPVTRAPGWRPGPAEEHRRWAAEAWAAGPVRHVAGPPAVDLPDLRADRAVPSLDDVRDGLAELRYQGPRWLERRAPLVFDRLRGLYHRLRDRPR
jgi:hypothetical protein